MRTSVLYVCTNSACRRTTEFESSPDARGIAKRCACGSPMKRPYAKPAVRVLSRGEGDAAFAGVPELKSHF
jgi:hypothetical protein